MSDQTDGLSSISISNLPRVGFARAGIDKDRWILVVPSEGSSEWCAWEVLVSGGGPREWALVNLELPAVIDDLTSLDIRWSPIGDLEDRIREHFPHVDLGFVLSKLSPPASAHNE